MKRSIAALLALLVLPAGCATKTAAPTDPALARAEAFIDAFYSFKPARLRTALANAPASAPQILYYQGWAEGGNYKVLNRKPCRHDKPDQVTCNITVRDDLIQTLGIGFDVTDTFYLTLDQGRIVKVTTSSDDPPAMGEAFKWLRAERPGIWATGPCAGFFAGGPTPQACVRAIVAGFADYKAQRR